jgi:hypothetical protein
MAWSVAVCLGFSSILSLTVSGYPSLSLQLPNLTHRSSLECSELLPPQALSVHTPHSTSSPSSSSSSSSPRPNNSPLRNSITSSQSQLPDSLDTKLEWSFPTGSRGGSSSRRVTPSPILQSTSTSRGHLQGRKKSFVWCYWTRFMIRYILNMFELE